MFDIVIVGGGIAAVEAARYIVATKYDKRWSASFWQNIILKYRIAFVSGGHFVKGM